MDVRDLVKSAEDKVLAEEKKIEAQVAQVEGWSTKQKLLAGFCVGVFVLLNLAVFAKLFL